VSHHLKLNNSNVWNKITHWIFRWNKYWLVNSFKLISLHLSFLSWTSPFQAKQVEQSTYGERLWRAFNWIGLMLQMTGENASKMSPIKSIPQHMLQCMPAEQKCKDGYKTMKVAACMAWLWILWGTWMDMWWLGCNGQTVGFWCPAQECHEGGHPSKASGME
jgi:hypothetical protein